MARYQVGIETEKKIIDATRSLLAEGGMEAATLKAICDRAAVRSGSFYNIFDSKEEAIIHVVRESIQAVDPDPDGKGTDTLDDLVAAYIQFFEQDPLLARVYVIAALNIDGSTNGARRRFLRHHQRRIERFSEAMQRGDTRLTAEEATMRSELVLGALDGLAFRWSLDEDFDFAKYALLAAEHFS